MLRPTVQNLRLFARAAWLSAGLIGPALVVDADTDMHDRQQQLEALRGKIKALQTELDQDRNERDRIRDEVRAAERAIVDLNNTLLGTVQALKTKAAQVDQLSAQYQTQANRLAGQQQAFGKLINATYRMGRQDYIKLLLNQEDPAKLGRALAYYKYLARARTTQIATINIAMREINAINQSLEQQTRELRTLQRAQQDQRHALEAHQAERKTLLVSLKQRITSRNEELGRLKRDQQRLEQLLQELQKHLDDLPHELPLGVEFSQMRGRLALPVNAQILARFGERKTRSGLRWRGLFLRAPEGVEVRAVFHGRVAFADWLRGFGLLLILDHGNGYMSLYSHNQLLYKQVGDWVATSEPISRVGTSGGLSSSGLYFEIRHNGKPQDPLLWCDSSKLVTTKRSN